jgi:hypothetical protein
VKKNYLGASIVILIIIGAIAYSKFVNNTPSEIVVRSATYGENCGGGAGNVTEKVQIACGGRETCDYVVDVAKLGDPGPNCGKDFSVQYVCNTSSAVRTATLPGEANGHSVHLLCR